MFNPFMHSLPGRSGLPACWTVLTLALVAFARPAAAVVTYPVFPLADLQADYDQFATIVANQHPKLYADRIDLEAALVSQRAQLREGMSELEFLRVLAPLVRRLNCGHTSLGLSMATSSATDGQRRLLPLSIDVIEDRLFVTRTLPGAEALRGVEVLGINGRPTAEIVQRLYDNVPADGANVTTKAFRLSRDRHFSEAYYAYLDTADAFTVSYRDPLTRQPAAMLLTGLTPAELSALSGSAHTLVDGIGWTEFADDYALMAIATFNFYDASGHARFNQFVDQFFAEVATRRSPRVILDLRGNGGGDPYCGSYLVAHFLHEPEPYFAASTPYYPDLKLPIPPAADAFTGPVTILIDGGCFSTTGHVCSLLRYHQSGRFVGEETGGSFACTAATQTMALTHTRLQFQYSTLTFATATTGLTAGRGIMPDDSVVPTIEDRVAGRDPVKELAISLFRSGEPGPAMVATPESRTVTVGDTASFAVDAAGAALRYQWSHEGRPIDGATSRVLVLPATVASDAGNYSVTITNARGAETSRPATLTLQSGDEPTRLINVSVRTTTGPDDQVLIVGFTLGPGDRAASTPVLVRAAGPQLTAFDVPNVVPDPRLRLFRQGATDPFAENEDWGGGQLMLDTAAAVGAFPFTDPRGKDAALLATLPAGSYSAHAPVSDRTAGNVLTEVYDAAPPTSGNDLPRLTNVSARAAVDEASPLIVGFVLRGTTARTVFIRGVGPGLRDFVGTAALPDPQLVLYRHENGTATVIARNADWSNLPVLAAAARRVGGFAATDTSGRDAVVLATLEPGVYSVHVNAAPGSSGIALAEAYVVP